MRVRLPHHRFLLFLNLILRFEQDKSPSIRAELIRSLPLSLRMRLPSPTSTGDSPSSNVLSAMVKRRREWEAMSEKRATRLVKVAIHRVVASASWRQGLKGVLTAGLWKAAVYGLKKVGKMRKGMAQQQIKGP